MGRKRYIELTDTEQQTLIQGVKHHPKYEFPRACQALLWSQQRWTARQIAQALSVCPQSVGVWFNAWQQQGIIGLMRRRGQGRKPILNIINETHQQAFNKAVVAHYQDAERIKIALETAIGQPMSRDTVKRFLKKAIIASAESDALPSPT